MTSSNLELHNAAETGDVSKLRNLISIGVNIENKNAKGDTALEVAVICENWNAARLLIEAGADHILEDQSHNILDDPISTGNLDFVKFLIDLGVDVAGVGGRRPPIFWAVQENHIDVAIYLLESGVDPNSIDDSDSNLRSILIDAAGEGSFELVEKLLTLGADANYRDQQGVSAVELARAWEHADVVSLLEGYLRS